MRCGFIEPCRDWKNPATTKPERTEPVHCNEGRQRGRDETEVTEMTGGIAKEAKENRQRGGVLLPFLVTK